MPHSTGARQEPTIAASEAATLPWYIQPCTRSGLARASAAPSGRNRAADLSDRVPSSSMTSTPRSRSICA